MDSFKNISYGILHGLWDSIAGMTLLLHIDEEIHQIEEDQQHATYERRKREINRRSPSPTPSSASCMAREEQEKIALERKKMGNPDERTLDSIRQSSKPEEKTKPKIERKIAKKVFRCCLLNGGFTWLSIILFEYVILPTLRFILGIFYGQKSDDLHSVWAWLQPVLSIIFGMMWVLPIFFLSRIVSSVWFGDIADAVYRVRKGRPQWFSGFSRFVADFFFSLVVQALFLVQSMAVNLISIMYVGPFLSFIHLSMLYSLYSFEYKWFNMGWELHRRLMYIEDNWPYFIGFGVPLTILTSLSSSVIVSGCIFSMFFPLFILSGNEAKPIIGTSDVPLRIFLPVIFVSNIFFRKSRRKPVPKPVKSKQRQQYDPVLTIEERYQLHQMQEEHLREFARRNNSREQLKKKSSSASSSVASTGSSTPSFRYQQPPPFPRHPSNPGTPAHAQGNVETNFVGMRPLIPTPVHKSAELKSSTNPIVPK